MEVNVSKKADFCLVLILISNLNWFYAASSKFSWKQSQR